MLRVDIWNLAITIVNLLVLYAAMRIFLFKPVKEMIAKRQEEADRQIKEAADSKTEAEEMKTRYEQSLAEAESEKRKIIKQAKKTADKESRKILKKAQEEADQVKKDAEAEAETRKNQIIKSVEREIADMVICATEKMVGEKSGAEADNALYNIFLGKAGDES